MASGASRRPDHRLVGVGETAAAEIRHRVGFAPDDVVEDPEAEILQDRADAEDVVVGADDHDGGVGLHQPPGGAEPGAREGVIFGEIGELVPIVVDGVDQALVGARQRAFELQVIGRIGEDEIDRGRGEPLHLRDAVADQDRVARAGAPVERPDDCGRAFRLAGASTQNLNLGGEAERSGTQDTHQRNHSTHEPDRSNRRVVYARFKVKVWLCGPPAVVSFSYGVSRSKGYLISTLLKPFWTAGYSSSGSSRNERR